MTRMGKDDVTVNRYRLDELTRKAKAHDAYLWATKRMADRRREVASWPEPENGTVVYPDGLTIDVGSHARGYRIGYDAALMDFSELVQQAPPTTE